MKLHPPFHRVRLISLLVAITTASLLTSCASNRWGDRDFRQDMRDFVSAIADHSELTEPLFLVIPQNGQELVTANGEPDGTAVTDYIGAIDGIGREDLFYGYIADNIATPASEREWISPFLDTALSNGVQILVTDYCSTGSKVTDSYNQNEAAGYISFAAHRRDLDQIPTNPDPFAPNNVHPDNVVDLMDVKNFLYLLDTSNYSSKAVYLSALSDNNYDLLIIDLFYEDPANGAVSQLSQSDVNGLRLKDNGGSRLVVCYMSIGEAEDYRFYWQSSWDKTKPEWLERENPSWPGNYKVQYWHPDWQAVIFGSSGAYLDRILDAGFDGVYLDIIDAFEYFE